MKTLTTREKYLGRNINEVLTEANLDYVIEKKPVQIAGKKKIPNTFALTKGEKVINIVSGRYSIVANKEAFAFVEDLVGSDRVITNAGEYADYTAFITVDCGKRYVDFLNNTVVCKLVLTNGQNGKNGMAVNVVPMINGVAINIPCRNVKRNWAIRHTTNANQRMALAKNIVSLEGSYFEEFIKEMDRFSKVAISENSKAVIIENLLPYKESLSDRKKANVEADRELLATCLVGVSNGAEMLLAVADYIAKREPKRKTDTAALNKEQKIVEGYDLLDKAYSLLYKELI